MHTAYLLLGSNLGDRAALMDSARMLVKKRCGLLHKVSQVTETEPWGKFTQAQPDPFLNQVLCVKTVLGPQKLMAICLEIEKELGRERPQKENQQAENSQTDISAQNLYSSRTMDIDILIYDNIAGSWEAAAGLPALCLPHPRLKDRPFAQELLKQINPDYKIQ